MERINKKTKLLFFFFSIALLIFLRPSLPTQAVEKNTNVNGVYEDDNLNLTYSGKWIDVRSSNYSGNSMKITTSADSSVKFTFSGTSFELYGLKSDKSGIAKVTIDGVNTGFIDAYNKTTLFNALLFSAKDLSDTDHIVTITNTDIRNGSSSSNNFAIDRFVVNNYNNTLSTGSYEENNTNLSFSGFWTSISSPNYSNGSLKVSKLPGSSLTFTFSGNYFEVYGTKYKTYGIAKIDIDGKDAGTIDSYSPNSIYNALLYSSKILKDGIHTVTITTTDSKNTNSKSNDFAIDKITVNNSKSSLTTGVYEEDNKSLSYSGNWSAINSDNYSGKSIKVTNSPGSSIAFTFSGTSVEIYGVKYKSYGLAKVNIDGVDMATIDSSSKNTLYNSLLYSCDTLKNGTHTVIITTIDKFLSSKASAGLAIDKIAINSSREVLQTGTYEDNSNALTYTGTWADIQSDNYSNKSMKVAKVPGSSLTFSFNGSSFELYGIKSRMYGKATINIDGVDVDTINAYNTNTLYNSLLYSSKTLNSGVHTVTITTNSNDFSIDKVIINNAKEALVTGTFEDNYKSLVYNGSWASIESPNYSNGTMRVAKVPGSSLTFSFKGKSFELYGIKSNCYGEANINIDGINVATINAYSDNTLYNSLLYSSNTLTDTTHTVTLTTKTDDFAIDKIIINNTKKVLTSGDYEEDNDAICYNGTWTPVNSDNYSNNYMRVSKVPGCSLTFNFKGTSFKLYGLKAEMYGDAMLNIDGVDVALINAYSPNTIYNSLLYSSKTLKDTNHTVTLTSRSKEFTIDKVSINSSAKILSTGSYEEDNAALSYSGTWAPQSSTNYSNGSMRVCNVPNSSLTFSFSGTSFEIYGLKAAMYGKALVTIDNESAGIIDSYSPNTLYNSLLYSSNSLKDGVHTVTITPNGTKNANSTSADFAIDKITINNTVNALSAGTYEEDNNGLTYAGLWSSLQSPNCSNKNVKVSKVPGSSVKFTFSGNSFEVYGTKSIYYGMAVVNIDGKDICTIDSYNDPTLYNTLLYSSDQLNNGIHTVTITSTTSILNDNSDFALDRIVINDKTIIK